MSSNEVPKTKILDVLEKARDLIRLPENWIKRAGAKHSGTGLEVAPNDPCADCFCMLGAVANAVNEEHTVGNPALHPYRETLGDQHPLGLTWGFNDDDDTTHEDVIRVFNAAIRDLRIDLGYEVETKVSVEVAA